MGVKDMYRLRLAAGVLLVLASLGVVAAASDPPLVSALKNDEGANAVAALLKKGADPNSADAYGSTALHWAVELGDPAAVALLLKAGANPKALNRYGVPPLLVAVASGNAGVTRLLLNAGADANTVAAGGETALMAASRSGNVDVVKALLAGGADVNARESIRGQTALM